MANGYRKFKILLYPDNQSHVEALEKLNSYSYCYILHDKDELEKDFDDEGETEHLKKAHWHVWLSLKNQKTISALAKCLGIEQRFIRQCDNDTRFLLYLTHRENPEKYQYDVSEIQGNCLSKVQSIYLKQNMSEDDIVIDIINLIDSYDDFVTIRKLIIDVCMRGYYSEFRRNYAMFKDLYYLRFRKELNNHD